MVGFELRFAKYQCPSQPVVPCGDYFISSSSLPSSAPAILEYSFDRLSIKQECDEDNVSCETKPRLDCCRFYSTANSKPLQNDFDTKISFSPLSQPDILLTPEYPVKSCIDSRERNYHVDDNLVATHIQTECENLRLTNDTKDLSKCSTKEILVVKQETEGCVNNINLGPRVRMIEKCVDANSVGSQLSLVPLSGNAKEFRFDVLSNHVPPIKALSNMSSAETCSQNSSYSLFGEDESIPLQNDSEYSHKQLESISTEGHDQTNFTPCNIQLEIQSGHEQKHFDTLHKSTDNALSKGIHCESDNVSILHQTRSNNDIHNQTVPPQLISGAGDATNDQLSHANYEIQTPHIKFNETCIIKNKESEYDMKNSSQCAIAVGTLIIKEQESDTTKVNVRDDDISCAPNVSVVTPFIASSQNENIITNEAPFDIIQIGAKLNFSPLCTQHCKANGEIKTMAKEQTTPDDEDHKKDELKTIRFDASCVHIENILPSSLTVNDDENINDRTDDTHCIQNQNSEDSSDDIPCTQHCPAITPPISSPLCVVEQSDLAISLENIKQDELTFSPLYSQVCNQREELMNLNHAKSSHSPLSSKLMTFSPLINLHSTFTYDETSLEKNDISTNYGMQLEHKWTFHSIESKQHDQDGICIGHTERANNVDCNGDIIEKSETDHSQFNNLDGTSEENESLSDSENSNTSNSNLVSDNQGSCSSNETPDVAGFSPIVETERQVKCDIVIAIPESDVPQGEQIIENDIVANQIVPDCDTNRISRQTIEEAVLSDDVHCSDRELNENKTYLELTNDKIPASENCEHKHNSVYECKIYCRQEIDLNQTNDSEIDKCEKEGNGNSNSFYIQAHANTNTNHEIAAKTDSDDIHESPENIFKESEDTKGGNDNLDTQHVSEQVVPENSQVKNHEDLPDQSSFYDVPNVTFQGKKCDEVPLHHSSFQWKSVYESVLVKNSENTQSTVTEHLESITPLPSMLKRPRPLRVGLSKRQKVRHLHQQ